MKNGSVVIDHTARHGDHTALMVDTAEKMYSEAYLSKHRKYFPLLARFTKPRNYDRVQRFYDH